MFLVDTEDRLTFRTTPLVSLLGYDPDSAEPVPLRAVVTSGDLPTVREALTTVRESRGTQSTTQRCRLSTADGNTVPVTVEFVSFGHYGDVLGYVRERHDRSRARQQLSTARDRFGYLFDLIQDAVVEIEMVDVSPIVRAVNPAFTDIFGYDAETVVGESLNEFIVPSECGPEAIDFDRRTATGKVNHAVITRETANGSKEFLYRGIPYDGNDGGRYGFAIYTDITAQQRHERHLRVLHRILRHNLRNELTVVLGQARHILTQSEDPAVQDSAGMIQARAETLAELGEKAQVVESVFDDSNTQTVDLADVTRNVAGRHRPNTSGLVETDLPETLETTTNTDIRVAIDNLVENAIEHNDDPTVFIEGWTKDDDVVLAVRDDGDGIPAHDQAVVFEDEDITQLKHATGIGLWLVRWVVQAAGGSLTYDRTNGWTSVLLSVPETQSSVSLDGPDLREVLPSESGKR